MRNKHASGMTDGSESSESPPPETSTDSTSVEFPPLNELLKNHLENCSKCQTVTQRSVGLGMRSPLCSEYQQIIRDWSDREGVVNNIVDHDEYGNRASKTFYERWPDQWR